MIKPIARDRAAGLVQAFGDAWTILIVVALVATFSILTPSGTFLSAVNFRAIAIDTSEILILAAGQTFVIIAAGIDLSIGALVVFCSVVAGELLVNLSGSPAEVAQFQSPNLILALVVAIPLTLLAGGAWGWINGYITVGLKVPPFIVTLGTLGMATGFAQVITNGLDVPNVPPAMQRAYSQGDLFGIPWPVMTAAVVVGVLWIILAGTRFGLRTYALGSNVESLRRAGVNVNRHMIAVYVLMGALCGIVALMDVSRFSTASIFGHTQDNLLAISAVVIGGTSLMGGRGHMSGTIVGAFIPGILRNGFVLMDVQPFWQNVAIGAVLILAVYVDQKRRARFARLDAAPTQSPPIKRSAGGLPG